MNHSASSLISLQNVSLTLQSAHKDVSILRSISCSVPKHKTVAVTGASGSGKTSLLMLLAGLERPTAGSITVAGQALEQMDEEERTAFRNQHIGIVFQAFHLLPTMSALENVMLPMELGNHHVRDVMQQKARAMLERVGLGHRLDHTPAQLSGGEQQRVAIARACVSEPDILLADEPTGNLDQATGETIISTLFELRDQHDATLILVTHDPSLAQRCDMQITMQDGEIVEVRGEHEGNAA